ncbi:MAG TPA: ATP-grasp domain-containing protein, partial [Gemmatimonadaceae bacterium]|nr:ATP-grasp domain-containing protein [Gemmatimonadaceae bacterium]
LVGGTARRAARRTAPAVPACVIGDADLVRCLGLAGIRSWVLSPPGAAARYSRFTRGSLAWRDPWEGPEALVQELTEYASGQSEPPVLFYQEDRSLLLVSRHREELRKLFRFVIADAELIESLVDKERFVELSRRLALPIPATWSLPAVEDVPLESMHIDYPVIVKPVTRRQDRWRPVAGEAKALRADNPAELRLLWSRLAAAGTRVIVQALVPGPETAIESYHTYVDDRGNVVADFTGRKIRTRPPAFGDSSALEITDAGDVRALGQDIVKRMGLRGVAKLDFKRAPDGALYLLEVNPRFTLWHHAGALAGVNIPALVHGDCVGRTRPAVPRARPGVRWCKVWTDRAAARDEGIPFPRWLGWALRCEAKSAFAWDDPLPLLGAGLQRWLGRRRTNGSAGPKTSEQATRSGTADPGSAAALHRPHGRST